MTAWNKMESAETAYSPFLQYDNSAPADLKTSMQKYGKICIKERLLNCGVENILMSINPPFALMLSKVICCRCIKMYLQVGKGYDLFPHTTILQQKTLNIFCQKRENLYNWMDNLWLKVENIVAKGEIARCFEQFLLLKLCFQKAVCCRGVRKRLYEGKG